MQIFHGAGVLSESAAAAHPRDKVKGLHFHDDTEIAAIADLITSGEVDEQRRIVLLSGKPASGRRSLVGAAVEKARESGRRILFADVDLDGYEAERTSPQQFLAFQAEKAATDANAAASKLAAAIQTRGVDAFALLSAAAGCEELGERGLTALAPNGVDWDSLVRDSDGETIVLHLTHAETPLTLRENLLRQADGRPGFVLLISCDPSHVSNTVVGTRASARFEVMPLDEGELRGMLADRGDTAIDATAAMAACGGSRGLLELRDELLTPAEELERLTAGVDEQRRPTLKAFLLHAALCGDNVPVKALLRYLGVESEEIDDWVDLIDETVGADSDPALFADRFQHPSLPGETVYGFAQPVRAEGIRLTAPEDSRKRLAREWAGWLVGHFPLATRAAMRLLAEICLHAGLDGDRKQFEQELAYWVGDQDCDALRRLLVRSGPRENLWAMANTVQTRWAPRRTLAVLDAANELGLPPGMDAAYCAIRSGLLFDIGEFVDAASDARDGLDRIGTDRLLESVLAERLAVAQQRLGELDEAEVNRRKALELRLELAHAGDERVFPLLEHQARIARQAGREDEANEIEVRLKQSRVSSPKSGSTSP